MTDPKIVHAKVIYKPGQHPNVEIESLDISKGSGGELVFKNQNHPGFDIEYHLDPVSLKDYYFPNDKELSLFVAVVNSPSDECPKAGTWDQFYPKKVKDSNKTLEVRNINGRLPANKTEIRFSYTLRVATNQNETVEFLELDPGGVNQNGPTRPLSKSALLLAGAALGVLATLGTQALLLTS